MPSSLKYQNVPIPKFVDVFFKKKIVLNKKLDFDIPKFKLYFQFEINKNLF